MTKEGLVVECEQGLHPWLCIARLHANHLVRFNRLRSVSPHEDLVASVAQFRFPLEVLLEVFKPTQNSTGKLAVMDRHEEKQE